MCLKSDTALAWECRDARRSEDVAECSRALVVEFSRALARTRTGDDDGAEFSRAPDLTTAARGTAHLAAIATGGAVLVTDGASDIESGGTREACDDDNDNVSAAGEISRAPSATAVAAWVVVASAAGRDDTWDDGGGDDDDEFAAGEISRALNATAAAVGVGSASSCHCVEAKLVFVVGVGGTEVCSCGAWSDGRGPIGEPTSLSEERELEADDDLDLLCDSNTVDGIGED